MIEKIERLPSALTSFGYRDEYVAELDGLIATVREHHPDWPIVIGRGPVPGFDVPTLEVDSPKGKYYWTCPALPGAGECKSEWLRGCMMKPWWIARVWHAFGDLVDLPQSRVVWTDADSRLNCALDFELDPEAETLVGAWATDPDNPEYYAICGGTLLFQGETGGVIENIVDQWWERCVDSINDSRPQRWSWRPNDDQDALTEVLEAFSVSGADYTLVKLDPDQYASCPTADCKLVSRGVVDHWGMYLKMQLPEYLHRNWPPPEEYRRNAKIGDPVPNINWKQGDEDLAVESEGQSSQ